MYTCQVSFLKRMNKNNKHDRYKIIQVPYDFTNTKFIEMKHQNVVVSMLWGCPSPIYMYVLYSVLKQLFVCTFINDRYQYSSYSYIAISVLICRSRSKQTYDGNDPDLTLRAMSMQKLLSHILSKCNLLFCPFTHFFVLPITLFEGKERRDMVLQEVRKGEEDQIRSKSTGSMDKLGSTI